MFLTRNKKTFHYILYIALFMAYLCLHLFQTGLLLAILAHHVCSISAMFSASLLMHMLFAAMATQVCPSDLNYKNFP